MIVLVFDFDDTLFPTSHFISWEKQQSTGQPLENFTYPYSSLSDSINSILKRASEYGTVLIITNAEKEWLKKCFEMIPNCDYLEAFLKSEDGIYSTMDEKISGLVPYEDLKMLAFQKRLYSYFNNRDTHQLIAFGDSIFDRRASQGIKSAYSNVIVKNFYMFQNPTPADIISQHNVIIENLPKIVKTEQHLDLVFR
jgi:hypothetical protein